MTCGTVGHALSPLRSSWHGAKTGQPDWGDHSHSFAFEAVLREEGLHVYLILNAYRETLQFELPHACDGGASWRRWIDTSLNSPRDIVPWRMTPLLSDQHTYESAARSVVVLFEEIGCGRTCR